jgi:hypothetical protein
MTIVRAIVAAAVLLCPAAGALGSDAPITGKKLVVRDTPSPRLVFVSRDAVPGPTLTGADDPTFFGAMLTVAGGGGESVTIDLPAAGWTATGTGTFRFRNRTAPSGISSVRSAIIVPGRRLKIFSRTPSISLNEPSQGSITIVLDSGNLRYCATFGGAVTRDEPGKFNAKDAPAPVACPPRPTTTSTSTSSTSSSSVAPPSTTTTSVTSTTQTSTTTSTSTTSTSTLVAGCPPPFLALGGIEFTIGAGTSTCGGPAFTPSSPGPFTGRLENGAATTIANLGSSCLYVGGGLSNVFPPAHIPDGAVARLDVSGTSGFLGLGLALSASNGSGPTDCTRGAGPLRHCANGAPGTNSNGLCTTDADCGSGTGNCLLDANCYFGPPIPLPSPIAATSSCIVNVIGTDACGSADLLTGGSTLSVALLARLYLTSDQASPCPRCVAGTCSAGARAGLSCTGVGSQQTSIDCLPADAQYVGQLVVNPLALSTGSSVRTDPNGLFCPNQQTLGAFGLATARTIRETGSGLLGGPSLFSTTLAGIFCAPAAENPLIDQTENLPGPAAVSVPGVIGVCLGPLCL